MLNSRYDELGLYRRRTKHSSTLSPQFSPVLPAKSSNQSNELSWLDKLVGSGIDDQRNEFLPSYPSRHRNDTSSGRSRPVDYNPLIKFTKQEGRQERISHQWDTDYRHTKMNLKAAVSQNATQNQSSGSIGKIQRNAISRNHASSNPPETRERSRYFSAAKSEPKVEPFIKSKADEPQYRQLKGQSYTKRLTEDRFAQSEQSHVSLKPKENLNESASQSVSQSASKYATFKSDIAIPRVTNTITYDSELRDSSKFEACEQLKGQCGSLQDEISKIFSALDFRKTGTLTKDNCASEVLPEGLKYLMGPILSKIKFRDVKLKNSQFYRQCLQALVLINLTDLKALFDQLNPKIDRGMLQATATCVRSPLNTITNSVVNSSSRGRSQALSKEPYFNEESFRQTEYTKNSGSNRPGQDPDWQHLEKLGNRLQQHIQMNQRRLTSVKDVKGDGKLDFTELSRHY